MGLNENEAALVNSFDADAIHPNFRHQRKHVAPDETAKVGRITLVLMILNRIIGSGMFFAPKRVLAASGCVGGALLLW